VDPTNNPAYGLFAVTDFDECSSTLPFSRAAVSSATPGISTLYANVKHTTWEQVIDAGDSGVTGTIYISWAFADEKTVAGRFANAVAIGEAVTWTINYCSSPSYCNTYTREGTWRLMSASVVFSLDLTEFANTAPAGLGAALTSASFGASSFTVDGSTIPSDYWGVSCALAVGTVYHGSATAVTGMNGHKNYMYIPVNAVDADDISSVFVKPALDYDPSTDSRTQYRFKLEGNNDRGLVRHHPLSRPQRALGQLAAAPLAGDGA
jgi:hypothetical protein